MTEFAKVGKWLWFLPVRALDAGWHLVKTAVEAGQLGPGAKVATLGSDFDGDPTRRPVIIYTANYHDEQDVQRVRASPTRSGRGACLPDLRQVRKWAAARRGVRQAAGRIRRPRPRQADGKSRRRGAGSAGLPRPRSGRLRRRRRRSKVVELR
ncbi:putative phosphothreonine lyase domain-containg protein [Streptomyces sannanensis]|uniref:putative phosphothreonine lyase domain-containing protein n=1 Tax=Streptomyces sannanensis TaxID=285536 RepID=UPI003CD08C89